MNQASLTNSRIEAAYRAMTPKSAALFVQAQEALPGGLVHDSRQMHPYPFYCERAAGPRKWDVDGNVYVDYYGGHGALLLGHCHPDVMEAVRRQLGARHSLRGLHRARSPLEPADPRADAERREGPIHRLGHRGQPHGDPPGARAHGPAQDRPIRRSLSRLARSRRLRRALALRRHADPGRARGGGGTRSSSSRPTRWTTLRRCSPKTTTWPR